MRLQIDINTHQATIPFSHQHLLTGVIHKWLGINNLHGEISLYSFSRIDGGKHTGDGLKFGSNGSFFFSAHDAEVTNALLLGIFKDKTMFNGFEVENVTMIPNPDLTAVRKITFSVGSPILVKRHIETAVKHYVYTDEMSDQLLKETLLQKMQIAGLTDDSLDIHFDRNYARAGTKLVDYDGIKNRASWCPVVISGKPETLLFAWNVGIGNSTGVGFGAVR